MSEWRPTELAGVNAENTSNFMSHCGEVELWQESAPFTAMSSISHQSCQSTAITDIWTTTYNLYVLLMTYVAYM